MDHRVKVPENINGSYFVDRSCVDCDTCRSLASDYFRRAGDQGYSYIYRQPVTEQEKELVEEVMDCCPAGAIGKQEERSQSWSGKPKHAAERGAYE